LGHGGVHARLDADAGAVLLVLVSVGGIVNRRRVTGRVIIIVLNAGCVHAWRRGVRSRRRAAQPQCGRVARARRGAGGAPERCVRGGGGGGSGGGAEAPRPGLCAAARGRTPAAAAAAGGVQAATA
jgi:hypothetical protein